MQETDETPLSKPKKPRSEKQIKAFEMTMKKRAENIAKKKEDKLVESAKLILSKQSIQVQNIEVDETENESESEIEVKSKKQSKQPKQAKPKMKSRKQIIIENSSSESDSESDSSSSSESETEFIIKSRSKKSKYKQPTQITRVKRSANIPDMELQNHPAPKQKTDFYNFFV